MRELFSEFEPRASSVGAARRFVRSALETAGARDDAWAIAQVVSELATNAVVHAASSFVVRLFVAEAYVRLEVTDHVPHARAIKRQFSAQSTTGRGLQLIEQLGDAWGVDTDTDTKTVWCEVSRVRRGSGIGSVDAGDRRRRPGGPQPRPVPGPRGTSEPPPPQSQNMTRCRTPAALHNRCRPAGWFGPYRAAA